MAASVIHKTGCGRWIALMKLRIARNHNAGITPQARPNRYCCASRAGTLAWPSASRICSPRSGNAMIGSAINGAAHRPVRSARRIRCGSRRPKACAASGATADINPIPKVKLTK